MRTPRTLVDAVRASLAKHPRVLLAVSGGIDSMALLRAVTLARDAGRLACETIVATFDHGTGEAASAAVRLVERESARLGLSVRVGRVALDGAGEAAWREARWRFLREAALDSCATIVTAHTRDDQIETVAFRIMRGSGARGLAGLYAPSDIVRPFLDIDRRAIERFARAEGLTWMDDPSNASLAFARNRLRHEILPGLRASTPDMDRELLGIARRAERWRRDVDALAAALVPDRGDGGSLTVPRAALAGLGASELAALWPSLAARVGLALDRRGTLRLAAFTTRAAPGARIQLAGGAQVWARRDALVLRRRESSVHPISRDAIPRTAIPLQGAAMALGAWHFRRVRVDTLTDDAIAASSAAIAALPGDARLEVRAWRPGDRMRLAHPPWARRVKRYLAEARVAETERGEWPVVLADGEIVWIPGVRRSDAAPARSGRPVVFYACERFDR